MRILFLTLAGLLVAGCSPSNQRTEELDPVTIRLEQIAAKQAESGRVMDGKLERLEKQIAESAAKARQDTRELEMRLGSAIAKLEHIEGAIRSLETDIRHLQAPPPASAIEQLPLPEPVITTVPQTDPIADGFPVRIYDIAGITVITGTQPSTREVETDEVYRDDFGQRKKRRITEPVEINEYGYRVRFSMQNLTDQTVRLTLGAGRAPQTFTLLPQEIVEESTLDWTPGSALTATVDGQRKRHPIPWE